MVESESEENPEPVAPRPRWAIKILSLLGGISAILAAVLVILTQVVQVEKWFENFIGEKSTVSSKILNIREMIEVEGPNEELITRAANVFKFNNSKKTSIEEVKLFLNYLEPAEVYQRSSDSVSARYGRRWEITMWVNSYGKFDTYGLRHGLSDGTYWRENSTYVGIIKNGSGKIFVTEPSGLRKLGF